MLFIHLTPGTPRGGLWCPTCNLPSGIEIPLYTLTETGVRLMATFRKCDDCGQPLKAASP